MNAPTKCPLCGISDPFFDERTHRDGEMTYSLYECRSCGIQFWWPLKNPGAAWYSAFERYNGRNNDPVWEANENHTKTLSFLKNQKGTVLDVGCGIGNFLALAQEKGWQGTGIDFDPDAIESARQRTGIEDLEATDVVAYTAAHPEKKFDLITFFDVLEHVDNHNEFIEAVRSLLTEKGYIAMSMPYRKHARWLAPFDLPPCHLTCWDRAALSHFLNAHGFSVVYMTRRSEGISYLIMKLRFRFGRKLSFGAVNTVRRSVGDAGTRQGARPIMVRLIQKLARVKDAIIFGLPALLMWLFMLPFPSRYLTLYAIARKN